MAKVTLQLNSMVKVVSSQGTRWSHDEDDFHGNQLVPGIAEEEDGEKLELIWKKLTKI